MIYRPFGAKTGRTRVGRINLEGLTMVHSISPELVQAIRLLPHRREVRHCGAAFAVSPFDIYATCPHCGQRLKVRSFAATTELEDVFDAVFAWMLHGNGAELARRRQEAIRDDLDE
jgi:hypothetical protein